MTIGNRMREIRGKLGMTQAELAEELDIDEKRLSDYENGDLVPSSVIQDLARISGFSPSYIFGWKENEGKNPFARLDENDTKKYLSDMIKIFEECTNTETDENAQTRLYNKLGHQCFKWGILTQTVPLIEYCFKIIINDKTCNGHISITAESLEKAYDKAYSIVSNNLSAALPDVDIPYYLKVIEEEGYPRYSVLSIDKNYHRSSFTMYEYTTASQKYEQLVNAVKKEKNDTVVYLLIKTCSKADWSELKCYGE